MIINFITLSCARNYGAVLQTYGLYKFLMGQGHDVKVIDYISERYDLDRKTYVDEFTSRTRIWGKNKLFKYIWVKLYFEDMKKTKDVFRNFIQNNIELTQKYLSNDELIHNLPQAQVFMTGSDQIWNPNFTWDGKIDLPYLLNFVPNFLPKIAYASSFGCSELNECNTSDVYKNLSHFNAIGVREESGKKLLENIGLNSTVVVDPTILCDKSVWHDLASDRLCAKNYILLFMINPDSKLIKMAKKLADINHLRLIIIAPNNSDSRKIKHKVIKIPPIEEWISYFKYAEYVITDSFHATIFSVLFHRQFSTSMFAGYNTRISNLLNHLLLEDRTVIDYDFKYLNKQFDTNINYIDVNKKLDLWRKESIDWLVNNIKDL